MQNLSWNRSTIVIMRFGGLTANTKAGFSELHKLLNGMSWQQEDDVVCATCALYQSYEQSGFIYGVKVGIQLSMEITGN